MKQSHLTTPRSLNECTFVHGYVPAPSRHRTRWWHVAITLAAMVCIGMMLAWRG